MNENQTNVTEEVVKNVVKVDAGTKMVMAGAIFGAVTAVAGIGYGIYAIFCKRSKKDVIDVEATEVNEAEETED